MLGLARDRETLEGAQRIAEWMTLTVKLQLNSIPGFLTPLYFIWKSVRRVIGACLSPRAEIF